MPRWETCYLSESAINSPLIGRKTWAWHALLMTIRGTRVIAQTDGWTEGDADSRTEQRDEVIARLAGDGWEPMPLIYGDYGTTRWYFKRPIIADKAQPR